MVTLGLISDTHGKLSGQAVATLEGVDEILHAGDIGGVEILAELDAVAPTMAVLGNTDYLPGQPGERVVEREGTVILLIHDIGDVGQPSFDLLRRARHVGAAVVIFGHSHRPADYTIGSLRFVNPGSATAPRGGHPPTVARLTVTHDGTEVEHFRLD